MPYRTRPWQTDAELEQMQGASGGYGAVRVRLRPPEDRKPVATYGLLITFLCVFVLEFIVFYFMGPELYRHIFTIHSIPNDLDWARRPWSPITATLSHSVVHVGHILFNSFTLYFFGPLIERSIGPRRFLIFFAVAGIASSILQAVMVPAPALGASGAIMGLIGIAIVLAPKSQIFFFPFPTPIPLWVAGIIFVLLDVLGAFSGTSGVGNVAHLGGMAIGLGYGYALKRRVMRVRPGYVPPGMG